MNRSLAGLLIVAAMALGSTQTLLAQVLRGPIEENPEAVLSFWTDGRMDDAWPSQNSADPPLLEPPLLVGADQSGYIRMPEPYIAHRLSRMTGILFYREAVIGTVAHCSASVVHSRSGSLIVTAAHCVTTSAENTWREMMLFIPAYNGQAVGNARAPLGKWPVRQVFIPYQRAGVVTGDDVAVGRLYAKVAPVGPGLTVEEAVGGGFIPRITESGDITPRVSVLGYPAAWLPGDGPYLEYQRRCDSPAYALVETTALQASYCAPQGGNSGGPLVLDEAPLVPPEVIGVVQSSRAQSRLKGETFAPIYRAADLPRH